MHGLHCLICLLFSLTLMACGPVSGPTSQKAFQKPLFKHHTITRTGPLLEPSQCRLGGVQVARGFDLNGNNVLDSDEVVSLINLCEGEPLLKRGLSNLANDAHADHC